MKKLVVILVVLYAGASSCELKPADPHYLRNYLYAKNNRELLHSVFANAGALLVRDPHPVGKDKEYIIDITGDVREALSDNVYMFDHYQQPYGYVPLIPEEIVAMKMADTLLLLEESIVGNDIIKQEQDLRAGRLAHMVALKAEGKQELKRIDSLLEQYRQAYNITESEITRIQKQNRQP